MGDLKITINQNTTIQLFENQYRLKLKEKNALNNVGVKIAHNPWILAIRGGLRSNGWF